MESLGLPAGGPRVGPGLAPGWPQVGNASWGSLSSGVGVSCPLQRQACRIFRALGRIFQGDGQWPKSMPAVLPHPSQLLTEETSVDREPAHLGPSSTSSIYLEYLPRLPQPSYLYNGTDAVTNLREVTYKALGAPLTTRRITLNPETKSPSLRPDSAPPVQRI